MENDPFEVYEHHKQVAVMEYYRHMLSQERGQELTRNEAAFEWVESGNAEKWRVDPNFRKEMFKKMEDYVWNKK